MYIKQKIAYKIVGKNMKSELAINARSAGCSNSRGAVLSYKVGETTVSKNGLCECTDTCCRGIHAFLTLKQAQGWADIIGTFIVQVRAERWWKPYVGATKIRALEVEVIKIIGEVK